MPGLVDGDGLVRLAPNLGWRDVDVAALLAGTARAGRPCRSTVDNEANLRRARRAARARGPDPSFLYVSGEIGIGAGIVLDGALFRGVRGWSGETGPRTGRPGRPACRCGARGCLEQYAGQEALLRGGRAAPGGPCRRTPPPRRLAELAGPATRPRWPRCGPPAPRSGSRWPGW